MQTRLADRLSDADKCASGEHIYVLREGVMQETGRQFAYRVCRLCNFHSFDMRWADE